MSNLLVIGWMYVCNFNTSFQLQRSLTAQMEPYALLVVQLYTKAEWRFAMTTSGGQSAVTFGPTLMPWLSVGN